MHVHCEWCWDCVCFSFCLYLIQSHYINNLQLKIKQKITRDILVSLIKGLQETHLKYHLGPHCAEDRLWHLIYRPDKIMLILVVYPTVISEDHEDPFWHVCIFRGSLYSTSTYSFQIKRKLMQWLGQRDHLKMLALVEWEQLKELISPFLFKLLFFNTKWFSSTPIYLYFEGLFFQRFRPL